MTPGVTRVAAVALLVVSLALVAGCGGGSDDAARPDAPPPSEPERQPDGTKEYSVESAGFAVSVPTSWQTIGADDPALEDGLDAFVDANPGLEAYREVFSDPGSVVKLVAADPDTEDGFSTNVNVVVTTVPGSVTQEQYAQALRLEVEGLGNLVGELDQTEASLPAGVAQELEYRMRFTYATGPRTVATHQYAWLVDGKSYVATFTTLPELADDYASRFAEIARSFRISRA